MVVVADPQLAWVDGTGETSGVQVIHIAEDDARTDVTADATLEVTPVELGTITSATLSPTGQMAGPGMVIATVPGLIGDAPFEVFVTETVTGTADPSAAGLFASATLDSSATIQMAYPPAGAMIPPNLGEMDVHWRDSAKDVYEVQLSGGYVTLVTHVTSLGAATWHTLAPAQWSRLSSGARGVDLTIRVRGLATASPATYIEGSEQVRIAAEEVRGGVYYWNTSRAAIMRFDMKTPLVAAEQFYPQVGQSGCVGCHAVSRDGTVVAYRQDGGNMNYGNSLAVSTLSKHLTENTQRWNFAAIHPDNTEMFTTTEAGLFRTDLATQATTPVFTTTRMSHPDVAPNGNHIVATQVMAGSEVWASAGNIVVFDYDKVNKTVGAPRTLVAAAGGVYPYYPSFSPDNQWVLYNAATGGSSYDNQNAQIWVKRASAASTDPGIRLTEAEVAGTYNSWPKWTPFTSNEPTVGGANETVIWFTVATRRPFGVRSGGSQAPQLWLAPFFPDRAAQGLPATAPMIRLPFQNLAEGNHIAQWTEEIVTIQ